MSDRKVAVYSRLSDEDTPRARPVVLLPVMAEHMISWAILTKQRAPKLTIRRKSHRAFYLYAPCHPSGQDRRGNGRLSTTLDSLVINPVCTMNSRNMLWQAIQGPVCSRVYWMHMVIAQLRNGRLITENYLQHVANLFVGKGKATGPMPG